MYVSLHSKVLEFLCGINTALRRMVSSHGVLVMLPTLKKVGSILASACPFACVGPLVRDIVLKLHVWISHRKIANAYVIFELSPIVKLWDFEKNLDELL